jgi:ribosomal protein L7/L12
MQVKLENNSVFGGTFDLSVSGVPSEQAAQLHTEVTALVFGFTKPAAQVKTFDNAIILEDFLRNMVGSLNGKILAIKAIRCLTTLGLKEAKDFVEAVENKYGISFNLAAQARF